MTLFCPKCQTQHAATGRCPKCSSRLLTPGEAADVMARTAEAPTPVIESTFARRVAVGGVVALGLHLAFREWASVPIGLAGAAADETFTLWFGFTLRLLAAVAGGVVAGAGRHNGYTGGLIVGAVCGLAWLAVDQYPLTHPDALRVGCGIALAGAGAAAAAVGGRVWPGPVDVPVPDMPRGSSLLKLKAGEGRKERVRPTKWVRVVVAVTLVVCGVMLADTVRTGMSKMPKGFFNNLTAVNRVNGQITAFLVLMGGVVAGAGTGAAVRHGVIAGLMSGVGVVGITALSPDGPPKGIQYLIDQLGFADPPQAALAVGVVTLAVVTVGGWLGGQLLPPIVRKKKLSRMD